MAFLAEIEGINRFPSTGRIGACLPFGRWTWTVGGITEQLRGMVTGSAWIAAKIDPASHLAFCNLCERMEGNKAIVRIARKLLNRIYYTLKNKTGYACGVLE
ncbi:hypothetical protein FACS189435_0570 [Bacteroidia bacterium]|nr:hypothetical protein FACS189435_0570 [Bacteroidia bacterium]